MVLRLAPPEIYGNFPEVEEAVLEVSRGQFRACVFVAYGGELMQGALSPSPRPLKKYK